jgi:hypothetical protein
MDGRRKTRQLDLLFRWLSASWRFFPPASRPTFLAFCLLIGFFPHLPNPQLVNQVDKLRPVAGLFRLFG